MIIRRTSHRATTTCSARSYSAGPRQGRKGSLYTPESTATHHTTWTEAMKIQGRRMLKAERDERMDITRALTPVRTYMGGFTRPTSLRSSNWFPGGRYSVLGKAYESPSPAAYEPHTVYLLESRYPVRWGVGRVDSIDHIIGVCREGDLPAVLRRYNSSNAPNAVLEIMDNAHWPFASDGPKMKRVKWWSSKEELIETLKEKGTTPASGGLFSKVKGVDKAEWSVVDEEEVKGAEEEKTQKKSSSPPPPESQLEQELGRVIPDPHLSLSRRSRGLSHSEETDIHLSSEKHMSRQKAAVADSVADYTPIISTDMRRQSGKIPFEVENKEGVFSHPSGFVPPTPAHHFSSGSGSPLLPPSQSGTHSRPSNLEEYSHGNLDHKKWQAIKDGEGEKELMPHLTEGILSGGVQASTEPRDEKIPTEVTGVTDHQTGEVLPPQHPSGFIPPTPAMDRGESPAWTADISPSELKRRTEKETTTEEENDEDDETSPLEEKETSSSSASATPVAKALRAQYIPLLTSSPFYRPLLTVTLSTRPLALTLARLGKGMSRGLPYHAALTSEERKSRLSFSDRSRCLRLNRFQELTVALAQTLAGARGGLIGIRFAVDDAGRGVDGEGLDSPIPFEKRVIRIGVGRWYDRADETKESYRLAAEDEMEGLYDGTGSEEQPFVVYDLDEFGNRFDVETGENVPWAAVWETKDEVVEGVLAEIRRVKGILKREDDEIFIVVPKEGLTNIVDPDPLGEQLRQVSSREEGWETIRDNDEHVVLWGPKARGILKARLEQLAMLFKEPLSRNMAAMHPYVSYPDGFIRSH